MTKSKNISSQAQILREIVLEHSESPFWSYASKEWACNGMEDGNDEEHKEYKSASYNCLCTQPNIRWLYSIVNIINGNVLFPIGSCCISKFENPGLQDTATIYKNLRKTLSNIRNHQPKDFYNVKKIFSHENTLHNLFTMGAFVPTCYNRGNPIEDLNFMIRMFDLRSEPSIKQQNKIDVIINKYLLPWLQTKFPEAY